MRKIVLFSLFLLVGSVVSAQVISSKSFDKITKKTTLEDLKKLYGSKNLREDIDYAPEGLDSFKVTKIFKNTPKEIIVFWVKGMRHKKIDYVLISQKGSPYKTADGLGIGSKLDQLLKVNGKKLNFNGTGWDYGGVISSYNNGKLEKSQVYFELNSDDDISDKLIGDVSLNTDMPLVKKNLKKFYVSRISVMFDK